MVRASWLAPSRRMALEVWIVNYYQRHIGDYIRDTSHLSLLEHGVYARLLDIYYSRESPLPDEVVYRLVGAKDTKEKAATAAVLNEFFSLVDGQWRHGRCDEEIRAANEAMERARQAGKDGAAKRWAPKKDRGAIATPSESQWGSDGGQVAPNLQPPIEELRAAVAAPTDSEPDPPDDPRKALWDLGVSVLGNQARSLIGAAIKRTSETKVAEVLGYMAAKPMADPRAYFSAATRESEKRGFVC